MYSSRRGCAKGAMHRDKTPMRASTHPWSRKLESSLRYRYRLALLSLYRSKLN